MTGHCVADAGVRCSALVAFHGQRQLGVIMVALAGMALSTKMDERRAGVTRW